MKTQVLVALVLTLLASQALAKIAPAESIDQIAAFAA